jgi:hypothetical protein
MIIETDCSGSLLSSRPIHLLLIPHLYVFRVHQQLLQWVAFPIHVQLHIPRILASIVECSSFPSPPEDMERELRTAVLKTAHRPMHSESSIRSPVMRFAATRMFCY